MFKLTMAAAAPGPFEDAIKAGVGSVMCSCMWDLQLTLRHMRARAVLNLPYVQPDEQTT